MTDALFAVVTNPHARGGAGQIADAVVEAITAAGMAVELLHTEATGAADPVPGLARLWTRPELEAVVAVGGDGTARSVAEAMARAAGPWPDAPPGDPAGAPLVIVPGGTGNSVYRELWSDVAWPEMLAAVLAGRARRRVVDLYRIVDAAQRAVLLGASAGFFRWTLDATARFPDLTGRDLYLAAGAAVAEELEAYHGSVEVDGTVIAEGPIMLAAVGGAPHRSGTIHMLPASVIDDGLLDVCVLAVGTREAFFDLMGKAVDGAHMGEAGAVYAQGRRVTLRSDAADLPFEHDGEILATAGRSITMEVVPGALPVAAPP